jgi:hypothetical protein
MNATTIMAIIGKEASDWGSFISKLIVFEEA